MHNVISLFSGAGGLDIGLKTAGFKIKVCIDSDIISCNTLSLNRVTKIINKRVEEVSTSTILQEAGLKKWEADLLVGGPPCQPFSKSSFWHPNATKGMKDPRASSLKVYFRIIREALPKAFLFENVPGFAYVNLNDGIKYFQESIKFINKKCRTNYSLSWKVLNAANYGIPQRRERLFIIGHRNGREFVFPPITHSEKDLTLEPFLTAWDSIGDLDEDVDKELHRITGKWSNLIETIPEGSNYLWHTEKGGGENIFKWRSRYWNFLLKLSKDKPSWTIQASTGPATGPFHWTNRRLTVKEMSRLQTFPDSYRFVGTYKEAQRQIGNAVPSALAELLGLELRRQFFGDTIKRNRKLLPKRNKRIFQESPVKSIPSIPKEVLSQIK